MESGTERSFNPAANMQIRWFEEWMWQELDMRNPERQAVNMYNSRCNASNGAKEEELIKLYQACKGGDYATTQRLLEALADLNVSDLGFVPLHLAVISGHVGIANMLVNMGADLNKMDGRGGTAILYARGGRHEEIVQLLLERGASDIDKAELEAHRVCLRNHDQGAFRRSAAVTDIRKPYMACVCTLASSYAEKERAKTVEETHVARAKAYLGQGPEMLLNACGGLGLIGGGECRDCYELAKQLLIAGNVSPNIVVRQRDWGTPLLAASASGQVAIVTLLLEAGADPNLADNEGNTPLGHARAIFASNRVQTEFKPSSNSHRV